MCECLLQRFLAVFGVSVVTNSTSLMFAFDVVFLQSGTSAVMYVFSRCLLMIC